MADIAPPTFQSALARAYAHFIEHGLAIFVPTSGALFWHRGADALDLLHRLTTNSLLDLDDKEARRTIVTSEKGRVIDSLWVIKLMSDEALLVSDSPEPSDAEEWIDKYTIIEDAEMMDFTDMASRFIVVGPRSGECIESHLPELQSDSHGTGSFRYSHELEDNRVFALRTDAAGCETWLVVADAEQAVEISARFESAGLQPADSGLFDFIRVKNRAPLAGFELTIDVNPLEAGLLDLIDFDKGCYVGQEVIARLDTYDKVQRRLVGFVQRDIGSESDAVRVGDRLRELSRERDIGWVTSVAVDPETGSNIGLGYVRTAYAEVGTDLLTSRGAEICVA